MKFYIENHEGTKVFEGTQEECQAEMTRLILHEDGYWYMFDETDHDQPWQEGGLEEMSGLLQAE